MTKAEQYAACLLAISGKPHDTPCGEGTEVVDGRWIVFKDGSVYDLQAHAASTAADSLS